MTTEHSQRVFETHRGSSEISTKVLSILEAIVQHCDSSELKQRLNQCPAACVTSWKDENSFDLVHHCILQNNIVALMLLLTRGLFKSPHEPVTWPYLHLVACLGRRTFISSIIQEVKYQNDVIILDWDVLINAIKPDMNICFPDIEPAVMEKKMSPIDVAALLGHIGCVQLLLDFWQVHHKPVVNSQKSNKYGSFYLSLACQANSPRALQLLLSKHSDKKEALEYALRMISPECVDVVLQDGSTTDLQKAFHGMNLFHVLYSYSSCLTSQQYKDMVEITSILIKHKQDVNAMQPSRTFPLHSLLCHTMSGITVEECGPFLLAYLLLLLQAGSDPNMDEISLEEKLEDPEENTAFGRRAHSSAINCFLGNLPFLKFNTFDNPLLVDPIDNYACKVIELLLKHGADLGFTGNFTTSASYEMLITKYHNGTALHLMLSTRSQSSLSYPLLQLLLHCGIDADARGTWNLPELSFTLIYALNILPFSLWFSSVTASSRAQTDKYAFTSKDLKIFTYIMKFMSQKVLVLAYREFLHGVHKLRLLAHKLGRLQALEKDHLQESVFFTDIVHEYKESTQEPWLLQRCCSQVVWRACRMHMENVNKLLIPGPLKNILRFFH